MTAVAGDVAVLARQRVCSLFVFERRSGFEGPAIVTTIARFAKGAAVEVFVTRTALRGESEPGSSRIDTPLALPPTLRLVGRFVTGTAARLCVPAG